MIDFAASLSHLYYLKLLTLFENKLKQEQPEEKKTEPKLPLDPATIPKFQSNLPIPSRFAPLRNCADEGTAYYAVDISEFQQQLLPDGYPKTTVWGYGGFVKDPETGEPVYRRSSPGPTFEAVKGEKIKVKWINRLYRPHLFAVDPTLHWANPNDMPMDPPKPWPAFPPGFYKAQWPVPTVTHLHGGATPPKSDGFPEAWSTFNDEASPEGAQDLYTYPNCQEPATLWYHDHAMGITRLNVYAGLAGFYLLRDPARLYDDPAEGSATVLPHGRHEIPLVIQDRSFYQDGSLAFTDIGDNPETHPYWSPEFFGDTIMVNGRVWPKLRVERRKYRFRILNGSNARFYHLKPDPYLPMWQIGTDGGYLEHPVELESLLLAPAERADMILDFTSLKPGTLITLRNDAPAPYPGGDLPDQDTVGQIMQFEVADSAPVKGCLPSCLCRIPKLIPDSPSRYFTLDEVPGPNGPLEVLLNNQHWSDPVTELPRVGSTEDWVIANLTMDTHPIHLHLVEFQLISRQPFDMAKYQAACGGVKPGEEKPDPSSFTTGSPMPPDPNERGWKDTVRMNPSEITVIRIRFAPQDVPVGRIGPGENAYPFKPYAKPGYVWHCHILDHEDNEMMRPYKVTK